MPAVNYKNSNIISISTDTTLPAYAVKTGTLSETAGSKEIAGTGTLFTTETKIGDWIVDLTNHEMRRIVGIGSNTACNVDNSFSNTLAGVTVKIIPSSRVVKIDGICVAGGGKIDTVTLPTNVWMNIADKSSREAGHSTLDFCDPIFVDGTGAAVVLTYEL